MKVGSIVRTSEAYWLRNKKIPNQDSPLESVLTITLLNFFFPGQCLHPFSYNVCFSRFLLINSHIKPILVPVNFKITSVLKIEHF